MRLFGGLFSKEEEGQDEAVLDQVIEHLRGIGVEAETVAPGSAGAVVMLARGGTGGGNGG